MENEPFNLSLRRFLKEVGISSQQEIERIVREHNLAGQGTLKVRMVLTADGTDLRHEVLGDIDLGPDRAHGRQRPGTSNESQR